MTELPGGAARVRTEFVLLAALFLAIGVFRINDLFLYTPDGARYLVWGNSIARGEGYVDATQPEELRFVIHAPLYPALLAPVELFYPLRAVPAKAWTLLWGLLALTLLYIWLYRLYGRAPAFAGALVFALNPGFIVYSTEILSDAPFIAFLLIVVPLAGKAAGGERLTRGQWWALLAASSTIGLLREVGVVVTACAVIGIWSVDRRKALALAACAAACLGAWYLRNSVIVGAPAGSPGSNLALAFRQFTEGGGDASPARFASQAWSNFSSYLSYAAGMAFYPLYGPQHAQLLESPVGVPEALRWGAVALFGTLAAAGIVRSVRRGREAWLAVGVCAALLLAASVYPVRDARFAAPILPLAIAWIVAALAPAGRDGSARMRRVALFAAAAVAVLPNIPAIAQIVSLNLRYLRSPLELHASFAGRDDAPQYYARPWALLGSWIGARMPPDAVLATPAKELALVSGGRKAMELDPGVPQAVFDRLIRTNGVSFLLAPVRWGDVRVYEPLMEGSRRFAFAEAYSAGSLRLYAIEPRSFGDGPRAETVSTEATGAAGLLRCARRAVDAGRYAEALRLLDSAEASGPPRAEIRYEALVAAAMAGDSARAAAAFSSLAELPQAASFTVPGRKHLRLASEVAAIRALPRGGERSMRTLDASRAYWEMGQYDRARSFLGPEAAADTTFFAGHLWNFHYNFQLGDTVAAWRSLAVLDGIDSANSLVRNFHRLADLRGRVRAMAPSPDRAARRIAMAGIYRDIELFDEAYDEGEAALRDDPSSSAADRFLADLYAGQGYSRRALAYYRALLRLSPSDSRALTIADSLSRLLER